MKSTEPSFTASVTPRPASERGHTAIGWLDSYHSFSFAEYFDPGQMGFRSLRVINEDRVAPGKGFGAHPHRSMEILSYVVSGELEHKDSLGNGRVIKAGEFQYMSAGSGVVHSEFNPSTDTPVHFLQIWIQPREKDGEPQYRDFDTTTRRVENGLFLLASPDGRDDSAAIRQDSEIHFGQLHPGRVLTVEASDTRPYSWLQVIKGSLEVSEARLDAGDGAAIEGGPITLKASAEAEFLLFRLS